MSVGRPRWTSPSTCSIACWTWDARAPSASPDPDGVGGSAAAPMIRAPRCLMGIEPEEHVEQVKRGRERTTDRYRWLCGVPLRGDEEALTVNWLMVEILNAKGEVTYRNSFITDLPVTRATVAELAACGRARWKIENESFNVLKNRGYHLEHNFGHGKEHLAALLACFNLVAFAIHTVCDLASGAWRHARETLGPRTRFFHNLQAL